MADRPEMTQDFVRSLLDYDPETGIFRWRRREPDLFKDVIVHINGDRTDNSTANLRLTTAQGDCFRWNAQFAGKVAGTTNTNGYRRIKFFDSFYLSEHTAAWLWVYGEYLPGKLDHINGIKADNRIANLRRCTHSQNLVNRPAPKNKSGELGIYWEPKRGTWKVTIRHQNQLIWGGRFRDKAEAIAKRDELLAQSHPDFRSRQGAH